MKIKNLKINQKVASKLATCVLVGTLAVTTLTGCGSSVDSRKNLLHGTILENTCVVTFEDGSKDIAVAVGNCLHKKCHHYYSVTSGEYFGCEYCSKNKIDGSIVHHYPVSYEENITGYLTTDELAKAIKDELDTDDIIAIVGRVVESTAEETNIITKTK